MFKYLFTFKNFFTNISKSLHYINSSISKLFY